MPYFAPEELYVGIDDFVDELNDTEWEQLKDIVMEDLGYRIDTSINDKGLQYELFDEAIEKLRTKRLQLSPEDERTILEIANKL